MRVGDVIGNPVKRAAAAQIVSDLWNHWRANLCSECIVIVSEVLLARLCKLLIQPASNYDCQCHTCRSQATLSSSSKPVGQGMASVFHSGLKSGVTVCLKWKVRCSVSAQLHTRGSGFAPPPPRSLFLCFGHWRQSELPVPTSLRFFPGPACMVFQKHRVFLRGNWSNWGNYFTAGFISFLC